MEYWCSEEGNPKKRKLSPPETLTKSVVDEYRDLMKMASGDNGSLGTYFERFRSSIQKINSAEFLKNLEDFLKTQIISCPAMADLEEYLRIYPENYSEDTRASMAKDLVSSLMNTPETDRQEVYVLFAALHPTEDLKSDLVKHWCSNQ